MELTNIQRVPMEYGMGFRTRLSAQEGIEAEKYRQGWADCLEYMQYQRERQMDGGEGAKRPAFLPEYPAIGIDGDEKFCQEMTELLKKPINERIIPYRR